MVIPKLQLFKIIKDILNRKRKKVAAKITFGKVKRFAAGVFAILLFPITASLTLLGIIALQCSKSYMRVYRDIKEQYVQPGEK